MNVFRFLLIFLGLTVYLTSCSDGSGSSSSSLSMSGRITDAANKTVGLNRISLQGNKSTIMSTTADNRGNYSMETKENLPRGIYQFAVGSKGVTFVLNGEDNHITIDVIYYNIDKYKLLLTNTAADALPL